MDMSNYKRPGRRKLMAEDASAGIGMDDYEAAGSTTDTETPAETYSESDNEPRSVFLSKEQLMGQSVKPGDEISFTIKSVDPETGEAEAVCEKGDWGVKERGGMAMDDFDKAMPMEQG